MNVADQGVHEPGRRRHRAIPRTLIFLTRARNGAAAGGPGEVLLLRGAPTKRLWANKYNGVGGHVEADEDILAAAERELAEETGLAASGLTLRGVVHIDTGAGGGGTGVLVFVFAGRVAADAAVQEAAGAEGAAEWVPLDRLFDYPLVDDLPELLARSLAGGPIFFGHYSPLPDGSMAYRFRR